MLFRSGSIVVVIGSIPKGNIRINGVSNIVIKVGGIFGFQEIMAISEPKYVRNGPHRYWSR